jgi:hypothetical protein
MKVYLAARFSRQAELRDLIPGLAPHEVVSQWLTEELDNYAETRAAADGCELLATYAARDLGDVATADVLVLFSEAPSGKGPRPSRGGKDTEFGFALGLGISVIVVGGPHQIFHHLPAVLHTELDQLREVLDQMDFIRKVT